jgi:hypothetical protein
MRPGGISLYVHNGLFLYDSIVHTYVKGATGQYAVAGMIQQWYIHTIRCTHVSCMYTYIHCMYMYMQVTCFIVESIN